MIGKIHVLVLVECGMEISTDFVEKLRRHVCEDLVLSEGQEKLAYLIACNTCAIRRTVASNGPEPIQNMVHMRKVGKVERGHDSITGRMQFNTTNNNGIIVGLAFPTRPQLMSWRRRQWK